MSADLSDFDPESIEHIPQNKLAIFILSTYGEGDPSDNAGPFWDWLTKLHGSSLQSLRYAAFGLGNSDYRHYNRVVTVVDEALQRNQAQCLFPVGKADDATGSTGEDFMRWKGDLLAFLRKSLQLEDHEPKYDPRLSAIFDPSLEPIDLHNGEPLSNKGRLDSPIKPIPIKGCRELLQSGDRNCLHVELDLSSHPEISYKTGDHLAIHPVNPDQVVSSLIRALGLAGKEYEPICIQSLDPAIKVTIPSPTTIHALFTYYMDICAPVQRELVRGLVEFAPTSETKESLLRVSCDGDTFSQFLDDNYLTLSRVLGLPAGAGGATWSRLPIEFLLENLPKTRVRYYSISSSSVLSPRAPTITALVSNRRLRGYGSLTIPGLATNYLLGVSQSLETSPIQSRHPAGLTYDFEGPSGCLQGGKVFAHIRRSAFKLPTLASTPLIMAAAGTGIAPFRAFVAERARLKSMGREVGEMLLFFGCRDPNEDYIYKTEFEDAKRVLRDKLQIVAAFSRATGRNKVYVQDKMLEFSGELNRKIEGDASVYICGKTTMARDIEKTLGSLVGVMHSWNDSESQEWVTRMKRTGKIQEDVWG